MKNTLDICYEIIKLVKMSPRREAIFRNKKQKIIEDSPRIGVLCPTRWAVRSSEDHKSIIRNYETFHELWMEWVIDFGKELGKG